MRGRQQNKQNKTVTEWIGGERERRAGLREVNSWYAIKSIFEFKIF